jgi:hypothetical protein
MFEKRILQPTVPAAYYCDHMYVVSFHSHSHSHRCTIRCGSSLELFEWTIGSPSLIFFPQKSKLVLERVGRISSFWSATSSQGLNNLSLGPSTNDTFFEAKEEKIENWWWFSPIYGLTAQEEHRASSRRKREKTFSVQLYVCMSVCMYYLEKDRLILVIHLRPLFSPATR